MKLFLTVAGVVLALTYAAWAQEVPTLTWGQRGAMGALTGYAGKMLVDPIFLGILIVVLLIASRFVYWMMLPIGGGAAAVAALISGSTGNYTAYAMRSVPFWAGALLLGIAIALALLLVLRAFGKQE